MMLQRIGILLFFVLSGHATAEDVSSAFAEFEFDPEIEQWTPEVQAGEHEDWDPVPHAQVNSAWSRCRSISSVLASPSTRDHQEKEDHAPESDGQLERIERYCKVVKYLHHVHRQRIQINKDSIQMAGRMSFPHSSTMQNVRVDERDSVTLQMFFEDYAERRTPVLLRTSTEHAFFGGFSQRPQLQEFLDICFEQGDDPNPLRPLLVEDAACQAALSAFQVPLYMVHNYIQRTSVANASVFLPNLFSLDRSRESEVLLSCPYRLHMFLMDVTTSATTVEMDRHLEEEIRVILLNRSFNALSDDPHAPNPKQVALKYDMSTERLESHAWEGFVQSHRQLADLYSRDILFAPGWLSARVSPRYTVSTKRSQRQALRFCYLDASNLNEVKQELRIQSLVKKDAAQLLEGLQSSSFSPAMFRRPAKHDTLWSQYVQWPKAEKLIKKSDLLNSESGSEQLQLSRRERFKLWQEDKRWDRHIDSLTLPVPMAPVVNNATRDSVFLKWQDIYQAPKNDITGYGYEVQWRIEQASTSEQDPKRHGHKLQEEFSVNISHTELTRSLMPSTLFGDDYDGKDIEAVVNGLEPDTLYSFRVRVFVGDAIGIFSDRSHFLRTMPCTEPMPIRGIPIVSNAKPMCVKLRWVIPADDGGQNIDFYLIRVQHRYSKDRLQGLRPDNSTKPEERLILLNATQDARLIDSVWHETVVCDLLPDAEYAFRVAPMNRVGMGEWSDQSSYFRVQLDKETIDKMDEVPVLAGVGVSGLRYISRSGAEVDQYESKEQFSILQTAYSLSAETRASSASSASSLLVLLSDTSQQVKVPSVDAAFDVWSSHFSPGVFDVMAEVVLADPIDASLPLRNSEDVRDRIVFIHRGTVPFVLKVHYAQQAGALGVIIGDVDGRCGRHFGQSCVPGADKSRGEGFAAQERHPFWKETRVPCVLMLQAEAKQLEGLLHKSLS